MMHYFSKPYEELAQEKPPTIGKWLISVKELFEYLRGLANLETFRYTDPQEEKLPLSQKAIQSHS